MFFIYPVLIKTDDMIGIMFFPVNYEYFLITLLDLYCNNIFTFHQKTFIIIIFPTNKIKFYGYFVEGGNIPVNNTFSFNTSVNFCSTRYTHQSNNIVDMSLTSLFLSVNVFLGKRRKFPEDP